MDRSFYNSLVFTVGATFLRCTETRHDDRNLLIRGGHAEVTGSNPVEALIFLRLLLYDCLNWKIYCNDHSLLSSTTAFHIYELFRIYITSTGVLLSEMITTMFPMKAAEMIIAMAVVKNI